MLDAFKSTFRIFISFQIVIFFLLSRQVGVASVLHRKANEEDKTRLLHDVRVARTKLAESGLLKKPAEGKGLFCSLCDFISRHSLHTRLQRMLI